MISADFLLDAGHALLGGLFVAGGLNHFRKWSLLAAAMATRIRAPQLVLACGTGFQIVAGALLAAGLFVVPAAFGLVGFTLAASVLILNFWDMAGPERNAAVNQWITNCGVVGGLLLAAANAL